MIKIYRRYLLRFYRKSNDPFFKLISINRRRFDVISDQYLRNRKRNSNLKNLYLNFIKRKEINETKMMIVRCLSLYSGHLQIKLKGFILQ